MPYTILRSGSLAGGLAEIGEQYQAGDVILYIASDDIEADLKQIEAAGGNALPAGGCRRPQQQPAGAVAGQTARQLSGVGARPVGVLRVGRIVLY
jgi:hypothetical protein